MPREILDLSGDWKFKEYPLNARRMRDLDADNWLPAKVPSSIYTNLIDAGLIDRTEINTNPEMFARLSDKPWIYKKIFDAAGKMLQCDRADLVFEGLDTVTQIWLNDKLIGKTDNMFIEHRFDVTSLLKSSDNILIVSSAIASSALKNFLTPGPLIWVFIVPLFIRTFMTCGLFPSFFEVSPVV